MKPKKNPKGSNKQGGGSFFTHRCSSCRIAIPPGFGQSTCGSCKTKGGGGGAAHPYFTNNRPKK